MKSILLFLVLMSCVAQGSLSSKYKNYGAGKIIQVLEGGYLVRGYLKGDDYETVYVEKHKLWKNVKTLGEGDKIYIYVQRGGFYSYETVVGAERSVKKYLYRGEKKRSKVKKAGDKQVF